MSGDLKLGSQRNNDQKVFQLLAEARAALLFLRKGWQVTMRDRPDLKLELEGQTIYADVKHQNEKETDRRDERAMAAKPLQFMPVGNVIDDEGQHGWQGMCNTAIKKEPQYLEGEQNVLVFVSYSDSLDLLLQSAVNEFDDEVWRVGARSPLRKLGGMMMLTTSFGPRSGMSNVIFCPTSYPIKRISHSLATVLEHGQFA